MIKSRPLDTRQIRYFVAIAEELHFGRAAQTLGIAQPALSGQIRSLERSLGVDLLTRSTRSVELSKAGELLYTRCKKILREIGDATAVVREFAHADQAKMVVGSIYPATISVLPFFVKALKKRRAGISLDIINAETERLVHGIEQGLIDFAFVRPVDQSHGLNYKEIGKEPYLLAIPMTHRLATKSVITVSDLEGVPIIARSKQGLGTTERYFSQLFADNDLEKNLSFTCNDTVSILALVSQNLGVGFVPGWVREYSANAVVLREVSGVNYDVGIGVICRRSETGFYAEDVFEIARSCMNSVLSRG